MSMNKRQQAYLLREVFKGVDMHKEKAILPPISGLPIRPIFRDVPDEKDEKKIEKKDEKKEDKKDEKKDEKDEVQKPPVAHDLGKQDENDVEPAPVSHHDNFQDSKGLASKGIGEGNSGPDYYDFNR
jgi:hypothetical protein